MRWSVLSGRSNLLVLVFSAGAKHTRRLIHCPVPFGIKTIRPTAMLCKQYKWQRNRSGNNATRNVNSVGPYKNTTT